MMREKGGEKEGLEEKEERNLSYERHVWSVASDLEPPWLRLFAFSAAQGSIGSDHL